MNKIVFLFSVLLLPTFAVAAPFCAVNGGGTTCAYYDVQTCQSAAGPGGACVANSNEVRPNGGFSQNPPIKFIDKNPVIEEIQRPRLEDAKQHSEDQEIEQPRPDHDHQNIKTPQQNIPAPTIEPNAPLTLVCNVRIAGKNEQATMIVNMVNRTVNDHPAHISDNAIEWEFYNKDNKENVHTLINRLTGSMSGEAGKYDVKGKCAAFFPADRKF